MFKKNLLALLMAAVTALALTSCGGPETGSSDNTGYSDETGSSDDTGYSDGTGSSDNTGYPDETGFARGGLGDTMHTCFFDYTVNSSYVCSSYGGYTAADGYELLVADVTVKNAFTTGIEMYDTDFQAQWNDTADDAYEFPLTCYTENNETLTDEMLPSTYTLAVNESRTGLLVYEIPRGNTDFSISYMERFEDESTGDTFFVYFTTEQK